MPATATPARQLRVVLVLLAVAGAGVFAYGIGQTAARVERERIPEPLPAVRPPSRLGTPNVVGQTLEAAGERLAGLEFQVGYIQPPSGEGTRVVERQEPPAGTVVERGTLVILYEGSEEAG